jgi:hypothetical protein
MLLCFYTARYRMLLYSKIWNAIYKFVLVDVYKGNFAALVTAKRVLCDNLSDSPVTTHRVIRKSENFFQKRYINPRQ